MENLKVSMELESPVILDRFTTLDSIILNKYFARHSRNGQNNTYVKTEDCLDDISKFIQVKNKTLSGSIWYIDKNANILPFNLKIIKKVEIPKMDFYKQKISLKGLNDQEQNTGGGFFKAFIFGIETLSIDSIYFYITGDKNTIGDLLSDLNYIGKKNKNGYGKVKSIKIIDIEEDKGYLLNKTTPSRPLACEHWNIETHKVAFYPQYPPYWVKNKTACYMPTTSLIEMEDKSFENPDFKSLPNHEYISPSEFAFKYTKKNWMYEKYHDKGRCMFCGGISEGKMFKDYKISEYFNDYPYIDAIEGTIICNYCIWSITKPPVIDEKTLEPLTIEKKKKNKKTGKETVSLEIIRDNPAVFAVDGIINEDGIDYIQSSQAGKNDKEKQAKKSKLLSNLVSQKLPFLIPLKEKKDAQHVLFKSTVAISNAMIPVQIKNNTLFVDNELLPRAIEEAKKLMSDGIGKNTLTNFDKNNLHITSDNYEKINDFYKKYDSGIRNLLNFIVYAEEKNKKS